MKGDRDDSGADKETGILVSHGVPVTASLVFQASGMPQPWNG